MNWARQLPFHSIAFQSNPIPIHYTSNPHNLLLSNLRKSPHHIHNTTNEKPGREDSRNRPRPARDRLLAAATTPDPDGMPLDGRLAAKGAGVAGVLADFHFFNLFAEGGAVSVVVEEEGGVSSMDARAVEG